MEDNFKKTAQN